MAYDCSGSLLLPGNGKRRGLGVGKTNIGELFFKERSLRLPSPWPERLKLAISERHLRLLITALIILFLVVLGAALFLQLLQSRSSHIALYARP